MSTDLIPFGSANLPAYLHAADTSDVNKDVYLAPQFNTMSIRGKRFTARKDGVKKVLMKPGTDDEVAQHLSLVVLRANMKAKTYFAKKYVEGESENTPPTCYSMDGIEPSPFASDKQSAKCATCKWNEWGSRINDDGESKGRACADSARLAIAASDAVNDPYLLRVPPASLKPLREAVKLINERKVPYNAVVMKVGFDIEASSPKLTFKPIGLLSEAEYALAKAEYDSDAVRAIVGADDHGDGAQATPAAQEHDDEAEEFDKAVAAAKANGSTPAGKESPAVDEPAPAPAPARAARKTAAPKPPAEAPAPTPAAPAVQVSGDMMDDLDALLGSTDD